MNSEILKQLKDIDKWTQERDKRILQNSKSTINMMLYLCKAIKK